MIGLDDSSDDTIEEPNSSDESTIKLSEYGFNAVDGTISVKDPELEIGVVNDKTFQIDADKQDLQDQFMRNMSKKFKQRFLGES